MYGKELILDLGKCQAVPQERHEIEEFFKQLCPWGKIEAEVSKMIATALNKPVAGTL